MSSYEVTRLADVNKSLINPSTSEGQILIEDAIAALQVAVGLLAKLTDTQPISAASLPLPTGAATEAKQDDIIALFPQDPIDVVPRFIDHTHSEVHLGNTFKVINAQSLGVTTVQYAISTGLDHPHMFILCDVYDGSARIDLYKVATFTGGTALTAHNKNQNSATTPLTTITAGVTSTDGTLIDSFYVDSANKSAGQSRADSEWVLEAEEIYRVDVVGLAAGTQSIVEFNWYQ